MGTMAGFGKQTFLIDVKTGSAQPPWTPLQTAGYNMHFKAVHRVCLLLKPTGKYQLYWHEDRRDYDAFKAALSLHAWWTRANKGAKT